MASSDPLSDAPFSYKLLKGDELQLFHKGKLVVTLSSRASSSLLGKLERADEAAQQRLMAKATGQFKFGNERAAQSARRRKRGKNSDQ